MKLENGDFGHANESIILELNSFAHPHPFNVNVLNYKRTFCEKISAVA